MTDHRYRRGYKVTGSALPSAIKSKEQVTHRATPKQGPPALPAVFGTVMREMAPLAQSGEILWGVVSWVMIKMSARQHDTRRSWWCDRGGQILEPKLPRLQGVGCGQTSRALSTVIPPLSALLVIPTPITKVEHIVAMGSPAPFATAFRTLEADHL